ncbi:hypothetical protein BCV71DRAFT_280517, partial [Rhizopus microsporus]
ETVQNDLYNTVSLEWHCWGQPKRRKIAAQNYHLLKCLISRLRDPIMLYYFHLSLRRLDVYTQLLCCS